MSDDGPPKVGPPTGSDPPFSVTFSIVMPEPAFEAVEPSLYRLLRTGTSDEHVDVWPEKGGRVVFAHAPVATTSASGAMTEGRRLADEALKLCPSGSRLREVQAHGSNTSTSDGTTFWVPAADPQDAMGGGFVRSAATRWWPQLQHTRRRTALGNRDAADNPRAALPTLPAVEFEGVAPGEADLVAFPYEFQTDAGVMVRLHDMQFLGLEYRAEAAQLTLRFLYDDPAHTPAEAKEAPLAVFRFAHVQVERWEDLSDPGPDPNRITAMLYVEAHRLIELVTGRTHLVFTTRRMSVAMEPSR